MLRLDWRYLRWLALLWMLILFCGPPGGAAQFIVAQDLELQQAKRLGYKVLVDHVVNKTPFPMGGAEDPSA